jgi:hypothetical protein
MKQITSMSTYMLNYFSALESLELAQANLRHQAKDFLRPEHERAAAAAAYLDCTAQIARLTSAHEAFMARFTNPLTPPSKEVIERTRTLAAGLAATISESQTASALIDAVTKVVSAWTQLGTDPVAPAGVTEGAPEGAISALAATTTSNSIWLQGHVEAKTKSVRPPG